MDTENTVSKTIELPANVKVTDEEKIEFYKAFLADKPFSSEVELFNGNFKIGFRSLDVLESSEVFEQLRKDQVSGEVSTDSSYMLMLTNYRLANSLVSIDGQPFQPELTREKYTGKDETYLKARSKALMSWPIFKLSAVAEAFKSFEEKVQFLTNEIQTADFWQAVK